MEYILLLGLGLAMGSASKIIWSAAVAVTQAPIISVPAPMALPYLGASSLGQFNPTAKLALILCVALDKKFEDLFYF